MESEKSDSKRDKNRLGKRVAAGLATAAAIATIVGVLIQVGLLPVGSHAAIPANGTPRSGTQGQPSAAATQATAPTATPANLTYLMSMTPTSGTFLSTGLAKINGVPYASSIWYDPNGSACGDYSVTTTYFLGGKYRHFSAALGMTVQGGGTGAGENKDTFEVFKDGVRIADQDVVNDYNAVPLDLDVSGASKLTLTVQLGNCFYDTPIWGDAALYS